MEVKYSDIVSSIIPEKYKNNGHGICRYLEEYSKGVIDGNGCWDGAEDSDENVLNMMSCLNDILKKVLVSCNPDDNRRNFITDDEYQNNIKIENIKNKRKKERDTSYDPFSVFESRHKNNIGTSMPQTENHLAYAIIFTSVIVYDLDNQLVNFYQIYQQLFKILGIEQSELMLKLYPFFSENHAINVWKNFLESGNLEKTEKYDHFITLCLTIYISLKCIKKSTAPSVKKNLQKKWSEYLLNLPLKAAAYGIDIDESMMTKFKSILKIDNTSQNSLTLKTTFSRHVDDPRGAFPMPEHYVHRKEFMNDLLTTAFNDSKTLFLTGDRGIGKSLFAKSYALQCAQGDEARAEYQYEHIIWTTYDVAGIYATISSLPCTENIVGDLFTTKIAMMKELSQAGKSPCLLIVDNFDFENTESLLNELKSNAFSDLIKTGWYILFTTKNNMGKITFSSIREKTLPPLSLSELKTLFHNTLNSSNSKLEDDKLTILIETYLKNNTYLVSLAAGLCDTLLEVNCETLDDALDYIIQAFKKLNVSGVGGSFSGEKDGNKQTFMEHYKTMFALSNIQDDKDKMRFLYNLACVPISGVNRISFFKDAFPEEEREKMRNTCNELISSRWVIYEKENNVLSLHPMVREIIKESAMPVDFVTRYICALNKKSRSAEFSSILHMVEFLKATYQILDDRNWKGESKEAFLNYCCLASLISCHFDTLHGFKKEAYVFGCRAIELLDQYVSQYGSLCDMEKMALAESYNDCGYAILHYIPFQKKQEQHDEAKKTFQIAYDNIKKAEKIVGKSDVSLLNEETDFKLALVQTSVQGNLAACHYALEEHPEGIAIHKCELAYRQKLSIVFALDKDKQQKIRTIIGNSHKGVATGLFHIGRKYNDFVKLYQSYSYHQEASKFYDTEKVNHNLLIAQIRMLGTIVELIQNHFEEFSKKEDIGKLLETSFKQCLSAAQFYSKLKFGVPGECEDWIKRTLSFGKLVQLHYDRINCFDVTGIIQQIYTLYYNNDKTREFVKKHNINGVVQDLKKRKENKVDEKNIMSTL